MDTNLSTLPRFDWLRYADATFAGLALLIPIPLLDVAFEWFFRRRMVRTIAARHGRSLSPDVVRRVNRSADPWWQGCLLAPLKLLILFLKRLSRKLLYFLTVKEATDQLGHYWHRAFLLDHMLRQGHLDDAQRAETAVAAMETVLDTRTTSPLNQLAAQILDRASHVLRSSLRWVRRGQEDAVVQETRQTMAARWGDFAAYLTDVAAEYDRLVRERNAENRREDAAQRKENGH